MAIKLMIVTVKLIKVDGITQLKLTYVILQNLNPAFGNCNVITLGDVDVAMSHLITE